MLPPVGAPKAPGVLFRILVRTCALLLLRIVRRALVRGRAAVSSLLFLVTTLSLSELERARLIIDHSGTKFVNRFPQRLEIVAGVSPASSLMREKSEFVFSRAIRRLGVILNAGFEVVRRLTGLSAETSEFAPGAGDVAGSDDAGPAKCRLRGNGARVQLVVPGVWSPVSLPRTSIRRGINASGGVHRRANTKGSKKEGAPSALQTISGNVFDIPSVRYTISAMRLR